MGAVAWFCFISFLVFLKRHAVRRVSALFFLRVPTFTPTTTFTATPWCFCVFAY
jgi:hypothetical protein